MTYCSLIHLGVSIILDNTHRNFTGSILIELIKLHTIKNIGVKINRRHRDFISFRCNKHLLQPTTFHVLQNSPRVMTLPVVFGVCSIIRSAVANQGKHIVVKSRCRDFSHLSRLHNNLLILIQKFCITIDLFQMIVIFFKAP